MITQQYEAQYATIAEHIEMPESDDNIHANFASFGCYYSQMHC